MSRPSSVAAICRKPSYSEYQKGCRCDKCREASRLYSRVRRGNLCTEPSIQVEADVVSDAIRQLREDAGLTYREIANRSGLNADTLRVIGRRSRPTVNIRIADAIYALQAELEMERPELARRWAL